MSQSNTIAADLLVRMNQSVLALPPKPPKTQTEAMEYMSPAFKQAMKRGYSLEEIQAHIQKEFGLTLQMSKMKRSVLPSDNAQADAVAKPKKTRKPKQKDTPHPPDNEKNGNHESKASADNDGATEIKNQTEGAKVEKTAATVSNENAPANTAEAPDVEEPVIADKPVKLNCPKFEREEAEELGAEWNGNTDEIFVPAGMDLTKFQTWLPKPLAEYKASAISSLEKEK